jgi:hypothetical protein
MAKRLHLNRPDLAQAVGRLARFIPTMHWVIVGKLESFCRASRETSLAGATGWAISYAIPRNLLGVHWNKVVPGVYIGSQPNYWGRCVLRVLGIRAAVNMRDDFDDLAQGIVFPAHLQPALQTPNDAEAMRLGLIFMHEQRARGAPIFVHCSSGLHRAAGMAIAYLVSVGWPLTYAKERVLSCRRGANIWPAREKDVMDAVAGFLAGRPPRRTTLPQPELTVVIPILDSPQMQ